jgi:hypothetical protein
VAGGWRRLHNEEFHNLHASLNIIRVINSRMRQAGHVACMGEMHTIFWLENLKRPLRRPRCRWVDNITMNLKEINRV